MPTYEVQVTFFVKADSRLEAVKDLDSWLDASFTHDGPDGWEAVITEKV